MALLGVIMCYNALLRSVIFDQPPHQIFENSNFVEKFDNLMNLIENIKKKLKNARLKEVDLHLKFHLGH